jgi:hypothetical protein
VGGPPCGKQHPFDDHQNSLLLHELDGVVDVGVLTQVLADWLQVYPEGQVGLSSVDNVRCCIAPERSRLLRTVVRITRQAALLVYELN